MLSLVVIAALAQAPQKVAVVYASNLGVSAKRVAEISQQLLDVLAAQELTPVESREPCDDRACILAAAKTLGLTAVMSISFAPIGKDTVVNLEALTVEGLRLAQGTYTMRPQDKLSPEVAIFVVTAKEAMLAPRPKPAPPPPVVENDRPVEKKLVPVVEGEPPPELIVERPERSRVPAVITGVGAVVVGVAAVVLLALASSDAAEANRTVAPGMAAHTYAEATTLRDQANGKYSAALGAGIAAGALAVTTAVLFAY